MKQEKVHKLCSLAPGCELGAQEILLSSVL